ncbi:MAG: hypothetical protein ACYCVN_12390 [Acidimicrobiales bacterium]
MPLGVSAQSVLNMPAEPYVVDDVLWQQTAKKNVLQVNVPQVALGSAMPFPLPQVGLAAKLQIKFNGTLVVTTADPGATDRWPYGLIDTLALNVNNGLTTFGVLGEDLRVRQDISFPAYTENVDVFPGAVGGGSAIAVGTYPLDLQWEVPIATELVTLTGALYAGTPSTTIMCIPTPAALAKLFGTPANAAITGTWTCTETLFVPAYDSQGRVIVPSGIAQMHGMTSVDLNLTQTGQSPSQLVRGSGRMQRLFMAYRASPTQRLSTAPNAAADVSVNALALSYGGNQQPYTWNPASDLLRQNNEDYGFEPPYDYVVLDTLKQDPIRDAIIYAGLTELKVLQTIDSAVVLAGGSSHLVQEDLW